MTAITDSTLIIETILGRTLEPQQLLNIGAAFVQQDPYKQGGWFDLVTDDPTPEEPDPQPYEVQREPTNEESAQLFLDTLHAFGLIIVKDVAEFNKRIELEAATDAEVLAARDLAAVDFL